ncbi:uncharacterized protein LOC129001795 [Macrosteles quadrilineatus]|uniref:uncharacterized protein LOC129001795 n=1 Tax=Macrosteles quadrilineatus TaxID=74068 RepID=UPI0023E0E8C4|nr:uncharacterized protein LOC129001795 [Macrosteles quadrilineatus]
MDESNPYNRITEFTPHGYAADTQTEYSYTPNWSREDYDDYSPYGVKSNYSNNLPYEGKFTPKYNPASNENLKNPPQTPKKVSFSNEFLYNDKSDTDVSSNLDEVTTPFECFTNSEKESLLSEHFPKKVHGYQSHDEDISFLKESIPYHSSNGGKESEDSENKKQSSLEEKASLKNPMFGSNTEHLKYSEENENDKSISILENKTTTSKNNILKPTFENVEENSIEALDKTSIEDLASTKGSMHNHNTDTPLGLVSRNDSVPDTTIANEIHRDDGNERMPSIEKLGDSKKSSSELENEHSKTTSLKPSSLDVDFDHCKNVSPNNTGGVESDMENTQTNIGQDSIQSLSSQDQQQKDGSLVNMQGRKVEELDELQAKSDVSYDGDNQVVQVQEQKSANDSHSPEQFQDPNTFIHQDMTEYPPNYDTKPNTKPENLYEKEQEGYVNKEYVEHEHGKEKYESEKKSTKSSNENQPLEYEEKNFRGSQQDIQSYSQKQYEDEMYTNPAKNAEHYLPVGSSENYVAEHEGEYPSEYTEQHHAPELQDSSRVPPNAPEQYKTDYNTEYQDEPQYGYNKVDATYDDQYEKGDPQYSQQQQPPYDQYQQEPGGLPYDQYDQQTAEVPYGQYQQPTAEGVYDQYEQQTAEVPYDQYEQQPAEIPYDQYEQQPPEPPYDQYEQQPAEVPYDQYEQQPAEVPYDQYEQQPSEVPYDQYEQQPSEVPYDQYEQPPADVPYEQYEQQPANVPYDQYEKRPAQIPYEQYDQQPAEVPYDQYEQQPSEVPYDQYEQQPSEAPYDQYEQQPAEVSYDQYEQQPTEVPYDQYEQQPAEQYDNQYQGAGDQYDNYNYPYDQTPTVEQTYTGDQSQNYVEETQPYDYKEPQQQPYDEQEPYGANLPYEETKQIHPEQVYNTGTPDYVPKPDDSQYPTQQEELATPYTQEELSSREAREPTLTMKQILESDSESSAVQKSATQEDSSDFDFSNSQK